MFSPWNENSAYHNFQKPKVTSTNGLFCSTYNQKPEPVKMFAFLNDWNNFLFNEPEQVRKSTSETQMTKIYSRTQQSIFQEHH